MGDQIKYIYSRVSTRLNKKKLPGRVSVASAVASQVFGYVMLRDEHGQKKPQHNTLAWTQISELWKQRNKRDTMGTNMKYKFLH